MRPLFRRDSITRQLAIFLAAILMMQGAIFVCFFLFGGTVSRLDQNAMDIMNERTINRKNYLESEMVQRWSRLERAQTAVGLTISDFLAESGLTAEDLSPETPQVAELSTLLCAPLVDLLRTNTVTGAFVILQGDEPLTRPAQGETVLRSGLYVRDMDPSSNPEDDSDIMIERGSSHLFRSTNFPMDVNWKPVFHMESVDDFYYGPLLAAARGVWPSVGDLGYWSSAFELLDDNVSIVTYSQPLLDADGAPYGVLGVELSTDYLRRLIPAGELDKDQSGAYLLALGDNSEGTEYRAYVTNGGIATRVLDRGGVCHLLPEAVHHGIYRLDPSSAHLSDEVYASVQPLTLYNQNTPFAQQQWVLIGLMESSSLFAFSASVFSGVLWLCLLTVVVGILLSLMAGNLYTRPIRTLADAVRHLDPTVPVSLPPVSIGEIDDLSFAIVRLSQGVSAASSRLSQIIELSDLHLAAFHLGAGSEPPYYTSSLFSLIGRPEPSAPLSGADFMALLGALEQYAEEDERKAGAKLYRLPDGESGHRWVRLQTVRSEGATLGVLTDVTAELLEKRRLEYERDYDPLSNLLNRRSFESRLERLERHPELLKTAAMLMMDLDNLKYLNDTYGHDCGDDYLRCAADVLRRFTSYGGLAFRLSGDEFYLLLSGYDSRAELQEVIIQVQEAIANAYIPIPGGQLYRLRASMGVAWYPEDSTTLSDLARYADFAMYEAKSAAKGSSRNFNLASYQRDAFLLYSREELNRILEEGAVDYAFQPIVSCRDGTLLGYEALMRPRSKSLNTPLDLLRIARSQSKLQQIEKLTWFHSMESFTQLADVPKDCLVFINSVSSHALTDEEIRQFVTAYAPYLDRVVIELSESDKQSAEATDVKQRNCRDHQIKLALDDFGTGYNNDAVLLDIRPDFVKIDVTIIRGIDQDMTRQAMLRNLVSLCGDLGVRTIAEGVETAEELRTIVNLGADYIQGFYTGVPSFRPAPAAGDSLAEIIKCSQRRQSPEGPPP